VDVRANGFAKCIEIDARAATQCFTAGHSWTVLSMWLNTLGREFTVTPKLVAAARRGTEAQSRVRLGLGSGHGGDRILFFLGLALGTTRLDNELQALVSHANSKDRKAIRNGWRCSATRSFRGSNSSAFSCE